MTPDSSEHSNSARLILICGLPGSGKTTLATQLEHGLAAVRLCPDEWLHDMGIDLYDDKPRDALESRFKELGYLLLTRGVSVILEFGFWVRAERDEIRERARSLEVPVELRYLDVPADELWRRIESRNENHMWRDKPITQEHLDEWTALFQPPTSDELRLFDEPTSAES